MLDQHWVFVHSYHDSIAGYSALEERWDLQQLECPLLDPEAVAVGVEVVTALEPDSWADNVIAAVVVGNWAAACKPVVGDLRLALLLVGSRQSLGNRGCDGL